MNTLFRIGTVGPEERGLLIAMYDRFEPLGAAFGLPPLNKEARLRWIGLALDHQLNLAAFLKSGEAVGHCFLVADKTGSAEMAMFVRQEFRSAGVGTALLRAALERGEQAGLGRAG